MKKKTLHLLLLALVLTSQLTSCMLLGGAGEVITLGEVGALGTGEAVLLRSMISRGALRRTLTGGIVVADEATFYSQISRVRMLSGSTPRLYFTENGAKTIFADVINARTIKMTNGRVVNLPGKLFTVNGSKVNVRTNPFINDYNVFAKVEKGQPLLVLWEENGWYRVQISNNQQGYIRATLLAAAIASQYKDCDNCKGTGNLPCVTCYGGKKLCDYCQGTGVSYK